LRPKKSSGKSAEFDTTKEKKKELPHLRSDEKKEMDRSLAKRKWVRAKKKDLQIRGRGSEVEID